MIGTILGMVTMFANMSDPSKLGPSMATALLATLYGAVIANLITLPLADKLHLKLEEEDVSRSLIIDGILLIRDQTSSSLVREMLIAYLPHNRAISVPEILAGAGVPDDRFASVAGKADTEPMFPDNPYIAANRRVRVTLLKEAPPTPPTKGLP